MTEDTNSVNDVGPLVTPPRSGDVISPHRAVLTLSKSMLNAGCFSLPFAWHLGGLWMSFVLTFVIAGFNWYGNHILVKSSQHLAKKSSRSSLDYGHFAKKVCDYSSVPFLNRNSKAVIVAILFIAKNMTNLLGDYIGGTVYFQMVVTASIATVFILATNMFTEMRVISVFAMISSIFFIIGTIIIMQHTIVRKNIWYKLPGYTNLKDTMVFIGISMYSFEGQTMILPIENKMENPSEFLNNFGVLPTTMMLCTIFMTGLGFFGYTSFGNDIHPTITTNMPKTGLYSVVNAFLMIQSILGHSIAMYVVFDMFTNGFRRKFTARFPNVHKQVVDKGFRIFWVMLTYLMAICIPQLETMIALVGVTSGTLCGLVFPPLFQIITFWDDWKMTFTKRQRYLRIGINVFVICVGFFAIIAGLYANISRAIEENVN